MKKLRKLFGVVLIILALVVMQLPVSEADAASTASDFVVDSDGLLTKYTGSSNTVIIPEGVVEIDTDAFKDNKNIVSVSFPTTLEKIEEYAFWNCSSLSDIDFGSGLAEIGDFAFANCKGLSVLTLPSSITSIGIYAFEDDVNLTDITIQPETMYIHDTAFDGCSKLVIHAIKGTYAYKYAQSFSERQKEFPEYEDVADYDPDGTSDDATDSDDSAGTDEDIDADGDDNSDQAGNDADKDNSAENNSGSDPGKQLSTVHVVGNQAVMFMPNTSGTVYSGDFQPSITVDDNSDGSTDGTGSGSGYNNQVSTGIVSEIPKYTCVDNEIIADQAYYCNSQLSYVVLPESIKEIGQFSYARSSLNSIVLPDGLEKISYGAFYHCDNLSYVTIPDSVTKVEPKAFEHSAWYENFMASDGDFLISGGVLVAYRGSAENISIPDGVRVIAADVFEGHEEIVSVTLPDSLQYIGEEAFYNCTNLSDINLEIAPVKEILDRAFYGTKIGENSETVNLPASISELGINAFNDGVNLGIPAGVSTVTTHELTAERLSNSDLRDMAYSDSTYSNGNLTVIGSDGISASLDGANDNYYLNVSTLEDNSKLESAISRAKALLEGQTFTYGASYELELTDDSGIPITKLGKQMLTVAIPVPSNLSEQQLVILTVDRNGQLEEYTPEIVHSETDDTTYARFETSHLSPFAIYGTGNTLSDGTILYESEVIASSAAPANNSASVDADNGFWGNLKNWASARIYRIIPAVILIASGFALIFIKIKRKSA